MKSRVNRGGGLRKKCDENQFFLNNFQKDLLFKDENKEDLNKFLADY